MSLPSGAGRHADAHDKLAQILTGLGRNDEARKEMERAKALGLQPEETP